MKKQTVANKSSTITNLIALLAFLGAIVEGIIGILAINVQLDFQKYLIVSAIILPIIWILIVYFLITKAS